MGFPHREPHLALLHCAVNFSLQKAGRLFHGF